MISKTTLTAAPPHLGFAAPAPPSQNALLKQFQARQAAVAAKTAAKPAASPQVPATSSYASPVDPTYDQQIGAAAQNRDSTLAQLAGNRTAGLSNYGYIEGPGGALTYDPNNPYSQAALMKKHYDQARTGSLNSSAANGQLYAGSYVNAQNALNDQQGQQSDALQKSLAAFLANNTASRTQASNAYDSAAAAAAAARFARAQQGMY